MIGSRNKAPLLLRSSPAQKAQTLSQNRHSHGVSILRCRKKAGVRRESDGLIENGFVHDESDEVW